MPWAIRPPVFIALLALVLVVPSVIDLHAVRVVWSAPVPVAGRTNLDELFIQWARNCQPDPVTSKLYFG